MVVVLDSEYAYKGIVQWSERLRHHGKVVHRDLWEQILWLHEGAGELLQIRWVPSHLKVEGNEGANKLARLGRHKHPNNLLPLSKRRSVTEWDALGLKPMEETDAVGASSGVDWTQGRGGKRQRCCHRVKGCLGGGREEHGHN